MGLPQLTHANKVGDREGHTSLSHLHPEGLLSTPSAASLLFHSLCPSPLGCKALPSGTHTCKVWSPFPGTGHQQHSHTWALALRNR